MSASQAPALDAIMFQLVASLQRYDADVERMVDTWLDMELYNAVSDRIEEIRGLSAFLPGLAVQWVELLIAHAELVHALWRTQQAGAAAHPEEIATVRGRHAECVASLCQHCRRQLARSRR